ncbi:MAG: glycosyltransferase [Parachlamydiaceae bacterium]
MSIDAHPLVSIVVPVCNQLVHVMQALQSIADQAYHKIELIIIDRGSTDGSLQEIEQFVAGHGTSPELLISLQFRKNETLFESINYGLSIANGEWLTVLLPEDFYHPRRLQTMIQELLCAHADVAFSYVAAVGVQGTPLPPNHAWWEWYERARCAAFQDGITVGFQLLKENLAVSIGNLVFSHSLYQKAGPFKDLKTEAVRDFLLRALLLTEPLMVRETLYFLRPFEMTPLLQEVQKNELTEIYCDYLCNSFAHPPTNRSAPCNWYWPSEFQKIRSKLQMDLGLTKFITQVSPLAPIPLKASGKDSAHEKKEKFAISVFKKSLNVTLISHEMSLTGAPKLVADLALSLKNNGYQPRVVSIYDGPMRQELEKHQIPVFTLCKCSGGSRKPMLKLFVSLLYTICFRIKGVTIGNSIASFPLIFPLAILRPWRRPVWYIHESFTPAGILKNAFSRKLVSFLTRWSNKINPPRMWFGSAATREAWAYSGMEKGEVMYWSGIPAQQIVPSSKTRLKKLLSVGTASTRKGTQTLINAFLLCLKEKWIPEDTTLTIVGFMPQSQEFLSLTDSILRVVTSKYKDNIKMVGSVQPEQLDSFYAEADLFIQSSVLECLPIALLTAMSKGMPIVTTDVDGCKEAIKNNETGYVCFPYHEPSLATMITSAINCPEKSLKLGLNAAEKFNTSFSLEATQKRFFSTW